MSLPKSDKDGFYFLLGLFAAVGILALYANYRSEQLKRKRKSINEVWMEDMEAIGRDFQKVVEEESEKIKQDGKTTKKATIVN